MFSYSKLYDSSTTLIENVKVKCVRGIYIDIFPLDGIGGDDWLSNYKHFDRMNMLLMTRTCAVRKERGLLKNASIVLMQLIPNFILKNNNL